MKINFNTHINFSPLQEIVCSFKPAQKKIALIAATALACMAAIYLLGHFLFKQTVPIKSFPVQTNPLLSAFKSREKTGVQAMTSRITMERSNEQIRITQEKEARPLQRKLPPSVKFREISAFFTLFNSLNIINFYSPVILDDNLSEIHKTIREKLVAKFPFLDLKIEFDSNFFIRKEKGAYFIASTHENFSAPLKTFNPPFERHHCRREITEADVDFLYDFVHSHQDFVKRANDYLSN